MTRGAKFCATCGGTDHNWPCQRLQSGSGLVESAGRDTNSSEKPSTFESTAAADPSGTTPSQKKLAERYADLVEKAIEALGSEQAVCRWLGLTGHGTLTHRLATPHVIKREHVAALEVLVERLSGPSR